MLTLSHSFHVGFHTTKLVVLESCGLSKLWHDQIDSAGINQVIYPINIKRRNTKETCTAS